MSFIKRIYARILYAIGNIRNKLYILKNIELVEKSGDVKPFQNLEMHANRQRVLQYYKNHPADCYQLELQFLVKHFPRWMQCSEKLEYFKKDIIAEIERISFDYEKKMYYAIRNNRKMYFKRSMTKEEVISYYTITCFEQSEHSAHRYLDKSFDVETGSVVFDIGAAEGIFGLDVFDKVKTLYLFEYDEEWVEALKYTFCGLDNVHIINKFVGDRDVDQSITLDTFCNSFNVEKLFIKMDIEGAEIRAIQGALQLISHIDNLKMAICAYHHQGDYDELTKLLKGMQLSKSEGYLCPLYGRVAPPYFRVGILRAEKAEGK